MHCVLQYWFIEKKKKTLYKQKYLGKFKFEKWKMISYWNMNMFERFNMIAKILLLTLAYNKICFLRSNTLCEYFCIIIIMLITRSSMKRYFGIRIWKPKIHFVQSNIILLILFAEYYLPRTKYNFGTKKKKTFLKFSFLQKMIFTKVICKTLSHINIY